jgi:hypothetical protein
MTVKNDSRTEEMSFGSRCGTTTVFKIVPYHECHQSNGKPFQLCL